MKTRELIKQLHSADPTGEEEVCVGNADIHYVQHSPAYYDGCLEVLIRDPNNEYYNIIGAELRAEGNKIVINTLDIQSAIFDNPKLPVKYDSAYTEKYKANHEAWRKFTKKVDKKMRLENFIKFVKNRIPAIEDDKIKKVATEFFERNLHVPKREQDLPSYEFKREDGGTTVPSWLDREHTYWNEIVSVFYMDKEIIIQRL